ncbi:uncharacterized protein O3C94_014406 [Discoglossus pictus]
MFIASKDNYPVYDVNNLYNTNPTFDWGTFRSLEEEIWLSPRSAFSFLFQFQEPGVYVIKLSSNPYKMMYIRVMPIGGQCYEDGPFFPTAPRHVIRNGIARMSPPLLKPDWPAIFGIIIGLLITLITCVLLLVWFQQLGWAQKAACFPQFRRLQLKFNFDSYSSKGSTVTTLKKLHPRMRIKGHTDKKWDEADKKKYNSDEFWDYDQQIDLECFNTHIFYDILLKQSLLVTAKLGHLKEEVKVFYEKLVHEVSTLKEVFVKSLIITGQSKRYPNSVLENWARKKQEAEQEIAKRKSLAAKYEDVLKKQKCILQQDMKYQEEHCVVFNSALRESVRLLEMLKDTYGSEESGTKPCTTHCQKILAQFEAACNRMYSAVMKESNRVKAWGVLGEGTGANLVNKDRTRVLSKEDFIGKGIFVFSKTKACSEMRVPIISVFSMLTCKPYIFPNTSKTFIKAAFDGSVREYDHVCLNPIHGLLTPSPHSVMLLSNHYLTPVPNDYFVHPETGKVLPIAGNVGYDPATSQLIPIVDSASGDFWKTEILMLPYIPYPICSNTGLPIRCNLQSIEHKALCEGLTVMEDPASGMEVPILAMTIHPQTCKRLAVGGTYLHPLTGILSPIEIGGPIMEAKSKNIYPILGVGFNSTTGDVVPLGGLVDPSGAISVLGDIFSEPLSGKSSRIQGAVLHQNKLVPHSGGYQTLLESNLLISQINVIDALKTHKDCISEDVPIVQEDFDQANRILNEAMENMTKSLSIQKRHMMDMMYNISNQQKLTANITFTGGNLGMIVYSKTELWIPAVLGMEIPDPGPSDFMVPILGVEHDFEKGHLTPLAGTMEDPDGKGLIPIQIGAKTIDPITGDSGPVIGAQINPLTGVIMPVVQSMGTIKEKDTSLLEVLEKELTSRERFWHIHENKEKELVKELYHTTIYFLDVARQEKTHKINLKEKMLPLEQMCQSLEESSLCESQRRMTKSLNNLSLKISQLPFLDDYTEEKEQQMIFLLVVRKTIEKLTQFIEKMEQEAERLQKQMTEWQKTMDQNADEIVKAKQRKVIMHLVDQFEDHIMKRLTGVDAAYCRVEYARELSKLQGLQATCCLLGTTSHYISSQSSYWNVAGKEIKAVGQMLIPMLKNLIKIIEENKNAILPSQEIKAPVSGYSSRSTLKASAANSDNVHVTPEQDTSKHSTHVPLFNNTGIFFRHQGYMFRFLIEKQGAELVHLDQLLVTEEINRIWDFYECYRVNIKENVMENLARVVHGSKAEDKPDMKPNTPRQFSTVIQNAQVSRHGRGQDCGRNNFRKVMTEPNITIGKTNKAALERSHVNDQNEWEKLLRELTNIHRTALQSLNQKHQEEVKSMGLNPGTVMTATYLGRGIKESIVQLALDMQKVYEHPYHDDTQVETSCTKTKPFAANKDPQHILLRTIATKFVRQELLTQIRMYIIMDAYNKLQIENCAEEVQKLLSNKHYQSCSGKAAAEETANAMEEQQVEKFIGYLTKSYKEQLQQTPSSLNEIKYQLKEEHFTLTEQLLQVKDKLLLNELANSENKSNMEHVVCCVLSQRHLRQTVVLLQDAFKIQKQDFEKLSKERRLFEDTMGHLQEDFFNLFSNKSDAVLLLMELHHVVKRIQLREHHLGEIANGLKEYCSNKVHILACIEEAHYLANELHTFREQKLKNLKEDLNHLSKVSRINEKSNSQSLDPNEEGSKGHKELLKCFQDKQAELEQVHRKQISEERLKLQDQLERGELNGLIKQKLIKEHDETVAFLEKTLHRDLEKLSMKLEEEMKKKKEAAKNLDVNSSLGKMSLESTDQSVLTLLSENICVFQQAEQIATSRITLVGPQLFSCIFPDGDTVKILESSPVLTLLKEVDAQLRTSALNAKILQAKNNLDKGKSFRDILDLQLTAKGDLTIVHPEELTPREFAFYQYGINILQLLRTHINIKDISLHVASRLPETSYRGNAFCNSFFFESSENNLFVSHEYLGSVGSFILLVIHCICHIASGDLSDDTNPCFLRTFFQALKICFKDGFLSQDITSGLKLPKDGDSPAEKPSDLTSQLFLLKNNSTSLNHCFLEDFKNTGEMLFEHNIEVLLRNKLAAKKRGFFIQDFMGKTGHINCAPEREQPISDCITADILEEKLDLLNSELTKMLEKEIELQSGQNYYEGRSCYFQMMSLEKECLRKKIEHLEDKLTQLNNLEMHKWYGYNSYYKVIKGNKGKGMVTKTKEEEDEGISPGHHRTQSVIHADKQPTLPKSATKECVVVTVRLDDLQVPYYYVGDAFAHVSLGLHEGYKPKNLGPMVKKSKIQLKTGAMLPRICEYPIFVEAFSCHLPHQQLLQ